MRVRTGEGGEGGEGEGEVNNGESYGEAKVGVSGSARRMVRSWGKGAKMKRVERKEKGEGARAG